MENALETAGIWPIKEYVHQRQAKIVSQVACWPIYELCTGTEKIPVSSSLMRWWYHDVGQELK